MCIRDRSKKRVQELERISGLTSEQAKDYLLKTVEDEVKHETAMLVKELETRAKEEAGKKAKEYVVTAIDVYKRQAVSVSVQAVFIIIMTALSTKYLDPQNERFKAGNKILKKHKSQ